MSDVESIEFKRCIQKCVKFCLSRKDSPYIIYEIFASVSRELLIAGSIALQFESNLLPRLPDVLYTYSGGDLAPSLGWTDICFGGPKISE